MLLGLYKYISCLNCFWIQVNIYSRTKSLFKIHFPVIPSVVEGSHYAPEKY